MARLSREECGNFVFEALSDGDWTKAEACEVTGLTTSQFEAGLEYVKDILAGEHDSPIRCDPSTYRYALDLSGDEEKNRAYQKYRLKIAHKQLTRLLSGTAEPAVALYGSVSSRRMLRYLQGALEEISILLDELGGGSQNGQVVS